MSEYTCPVNACDRDFDTERGLNSHKGHEHSRSDFVDSVFCSECEKEYYPEPVKVNKVNNHFCSNECKFSWMDQKVTVECSWCGSEKRESKSRYKRNKNFFIVLNQINIIQRPLIQRYIRS